MTDTAAPTDADMEAFRQRCRTFLEENAEPLALNGPDERSDQSVAHTRAFQKKLFDADLAGLTYGKEFGGQGLTKAHERAWREEYARFPDCTGDLTISHGMCMPIMNDFGSDDLKREFMPLGISGQ
jgi:alkylation response protein AidB-like acyl-CoA dehydrogenase